MHVVLWDFSILKVSTKIDLQNLIQSKNVSSSIQHLLLTHSLFLLLSSFSGGRTASEIVGWVVKNSGPPAVELTEVDAAKEFIAKDEVVVVGFFESNTSEKAVAYLAAAAVMDSVLFAITKSSDIAKALGAEMETIVVYRPVNSTSFSHIHIHMACT